MFDKCFFKKGNLIVCSHPFDSEEGEDFNNTPFFFENMNFSIKSIREDYFGVFLSYKIERPILKDDVEDVEMALSSISNVILPLDDLDIQLDDAKYEYIMKEKLAGREIDVLSSATREDLVRIIKKSINGNYIYNLVYNEHGVARTGTAQFNVKVELDAGHKNPIRLLVSLEYKPDDKILRVITMF